MIGSLPFFNAPAVHEGVAISGNKIILRHKTRTLESAAAQETNFLLAFQHQRDADAFRQQLWEKRSLIEAAVRHCFKLGEGDKCTLLPPQAWLQGGFNLCTFVDIESRGIARRVVFRCPMTHKLAERQYPGTLDEKMANEVATYAWMQQHCPDIRIPLLYSFAFLGGGHMRPPPATGLAYMILEHIGPETGQMLSMSWKRYKDDSERRNRLFQGMTRIMLSIARLPQPHIGAFRFNAADSTITLTNRPLTCTSIIFENEGASRAIRPNQMYRTTDSFASDMLTLYDNYYDNYFLHHPHAALDEDDARDRTTIRTLLRTVAHHFILPERRDGPFLLQLDDFHQSNIFVDDDWNVTCLLDLEWISALPVEAMSVPYWLTDCSIDSVTGDDYKSFADTRRAFLAAMDDQIKTINLEHTIPIADIMRQTWDSKAT
ncbi:hypothetical protein N0V88_000783 [Collariella sp. IMI 366227]|nr:hypothetical protein N0V88_000783 [Collariella sp. IMI 366227]